MAAWHFAGFMRPLRIVPGPVPPPTSTPSLSLDSSSFGAFSFRSSHTVSTRVLLLLGATRGRNFFCRVAITRQSPLPFGTVDGCPLRGLRRSSLPNDRSAPSPRKDTRPPLCKSSTPFTATRGCREFTKGKTQQ